MDTEPLVEMVQAIIVALYNYNEVTMTEPDTGIVKQIRTASRALVREFGFLNKTLAGTDMSASAVHAIVEIGIAGSMTASGLSETLMLEKSTVSRLLKALIRHGHLTERRHRNDARFKILHLTAKGKKSFVSITRYAEKQVRNALGELSAAEHNRIADGITAYAHALGQNHAQPPASAYNIETGYTPGIIGRITEMHSRYYSATAAFGAQFEARVAGELGEFTTRLDRPNNQMWRIERHGAILGAIVIDGEDIGNGHAHLRWFIVDDVLRGIGIGKRLLNEALAFCDKRGFAETHLWTFSGLDAARALYESNGFTLIDEYQGDQWGKMLTEQRFRRLTPGT